MLSTAFPGSAAAGADRLRLGQAFAALFIIDRIENMIGPKGTNANNFGHLGESEFCRRPTSIAWMPCKTWRKEPFAGLDARLTMQITHCLTCSVTTLCYYPI